MSSTNNHVTNHPPPRTNDGFGRIRIPNDGLPTKEKRYKGADNMLKFAYGSQNWIHIFDERQDANNIQVFDPNNQADILARVNPNPTSFR